MRAEAQTAWAVGVLAALVASNDTWAACKARGDVDHVPIPPVVCPRHASLMPYHVKQHIRVP